MGKSNRIKQSRVTAQVKTPGSYKKKTGMSNWAMNLITILVVCAILLSGVAIWISSNGIIMRNRTAMKTENFRVDGNMMTYYFNSTYQNFLSSYSSYLSYLSLDTAKSLHKQQFGDTTANANALDASFLGEFDGTWFEYFMSKTQDEVEAMLLYCEEAKKMNIELDEHDLEDIETTIESIKATATTLGYTANAYFANAFGEGVKESDVRNAMKLSSLANKGMTAISEKLTDAISDERIEAAYNENPTQFNLVNYTYHSFSVSYETVKKDVTAEKADATDDEILEAFKQEIEEAKQQADLLLANADTLVAFETFIIKDIIDDYYSVKFDAYEFPEDMSLNDEQLAAIRTVIENQIIDEILNDKEAADAVTAVEEKYTIAEIEISKEIADGFNKVKKDVADSTDTAFLARRQEKVSHLDNDEFSTWAFDSERKIGDTKKILSGDGSDESKEFELTEKQFNVSVYYITTPQYRDTEKTKNLAYMTFSTEDSAKEAIEALTAAGTVDQTVFDRIAEEKHAHGDILENYVKGDMGNSTFDDWVFAEDTTIGSYTTTPIKLSDSSYIVLYYTADGDEAWHVSVQNDIFNDDYDAYFHTMEETYAIEVKANVLKKVKVIAA